MLRWVEEYVRSERTHQQLESTAWKWYTSVHPDDLEVVTVRSSAVIKALKQYVETVERCMHSER